MFKGCMRKSIFDRLLQIQHYLATGHAKEATLALKMIKAELKQGSCSVPVNLYVEAKIEYIKSRKGEFEETKELKTFARPFLQSENPLKDFLAEKITQRLVRTYEQTTKSMHRSKNYQLNTHAVTSLFVLNGGPCFEAVVNDEVSIERG
jgi:hypothetical protein